MSGQWSPSSRSRGREEGTYSVSDVRTGGLVRTNQVLSSQNVPIRSRGS
jgi:hypothetical protein